MKPATLVLALFALSALLPSGSALARRHECRLSSLSTTCCDEPARWGPRHDPAGARLAITSLDRDADLILTDDMVAFQLSDRVMRKVDRKLRHRLDEDDDNVLANAIRTAVVSGVRALLDHSVGCRIRDLKDVEYRNGRLIFTTEGNRLIFEDMSVHDRDVVESFSQRDALAFVREFRRAKAGVR